MVELEIGPEDRYHTLVFLVNTASNYNFSLGQSRNKICDPEAFRQVDLNSIEYRMR